MPSICLILDSVIFTDLNLTVHPINSHSNQKFELQVFETLTKTQIRIWIFFMIAISSWIAVVTYYLWYYTFNVDLPYLFGSSQGYFSVWGYVLNILLKKINFSLNTMLIGFMLIKKSVSYSNDLFITLSAES